MDKPESKTGTFIKRSVAEYGIALIFLIAGIVILWDSYRIGAGWGDRGPQSGYFPFRIGIIICVSAIAVMIETWRSNFELDESFVTRQELKPVLQVLIPIVGFVAVSQFLGMYVGGFLLIAGFMRLLGKYSLFRCVAVATGVIGVTFWLFEIQFMVPLIKGPLEAMFGY
jgi:putative tricarboxylic transport membrane protein